MKNLYVKPEMEIIDVETSNIMVNGSEGAGSGSTGTDTPWEDTKHKNPIWKD